MKGFIVGYFEEWAFDRVSKIVGYYTIWNKALQMTKHLERSNLDNYRGLRQVYLVEIEANKSYDMTSRLADWIDEYPHYLIRTEKGITTLRNSKGRTFTIELPEPVETVRPEPARNTKPSTQSSEGWSNTKHKRPRNPRPKKLKSRNE